MNSPIIYLLTIVVLFTILIARFWHKRMFRVVLFYGIGAFIGATIYYTLIVYVLQKDTDYINIEIGPLFYLFSIFIIMFIPFKKLNVSFDNLSENTCLITVFKKICIVSAILSFILFIIDIITLRTYSISSFASVYENRKIESKNIVYYIGQLKYYISYFVIPLFFYFLRKGRSYKFYILCSAFSFLSSLVHQLTLGGRGTIVNYINYAVFFYVIYNKLIVYDLRNKLKKITIILFAMLVVSLSIITWSRYSTFETNEDTTIGLASWVALYIGEGPLAYSTYMWNTEVLTEGDNSFSFVKNLLGYDTFKDNFERRLFWEVRQKIPNYIFYTVVGDIHSDIGPFLTVLFFVLLAWIVSNFIKKRNKMGWRLQDFVLLQLYFEFVTMGVMVNCYKTYDSQWQIVCTIILCVVLNMLERNKSSNKYAKISNRNTCL